MKTRKKFSSSFKTKVVLEVIKEQDSVSELSKKYEIHTKQIYRWKQEFVKNASLIFEKPNKSKEDLKDSDNKKLYEKIGQLQVENDFLKNALS